MARHLARGCRTLAAALWIGAATARAQWTAVSLHPTGATDSRACAVGAGQQVGYAIVGTGPRGGLWTGSAASWVELTPATAFESRVFAVDAGEQAGWADPGPPWQGNEQAGVWSGTAASWINLHPVWPTGYPLTFSTSYVLGASGGQQVGAVYPLGGTGDWRASSWSGSQASWVSLHPALASWSFAYDVDGGQQVGWARVSNVSAASLWTGSAASWTSLHPAGAVLSRAHAVHAGLQVGFAKFGGSDHAGLWRGTAASWIDLNPQGASSSQALAVHDAQQAGYAVISGTTRAGVWNGTAGSWSDLHAVAPAGFAATWALGIWHDATTTYVVGYGIDTGANPSHEEALLWTRPNWLSTYCTAGTTTNGCVPAITGAGVASATAGAGFTISVANVEGQRAGLLIYGISGQAASPWGAGTSFLCVKTPVQRMSPISSGGTDSLCDGTLSEDWNAFIAGHPAALGQTFIGGETVWTQGWFRDPPSPKHTNLSDGLMFTVSP